MGRGRCRDIWKRDKGWRVGGVWVKRGKLGKEKGKGGEDWVIAGVKGQSFWVWGFDFWGENWSRVSQF